LHAILIAVADLRAAAISLAISLGFGAVAWLFGTLSATASSRMTSRPAAKTGLAPTP
jgi:hypothetical protein